jgi:hypothetical protein
VVKTAVETVVKTAVETAGKWWSNGSLSQPLSNGGDLMFNLRANPLASQMALASGGT